MKPILKKVKNGNLFFEVDKNIFCRESIIASTYKFTEDCYIHVDSISDGTFEVCFASKEGRNVSLEKIALDFCNELLDQQLRLDTESRYGHIRHIIVEHAFSPIDDLTKRIKKQK